MRLLESIQSTMATYRLMLVLVNEGEAVGRLDEFEADDLREELACRLSALSAEYCLYTAAPDPNSVTVISY
mgnify:CR=1 FL=1